MQNLKINPAFAGKVVTKDIGYTKITIEVDKLKPGQYHRVYTMGFKEIFLTDGQEEKTTTSDKETANSGGTTPIVEQVQGVAKKPRKKRSNS